LVFCGPPAAFTKNQKLGAQYLNVLSCICVLDQTTSSPVTVVPGLLLVFGDRRGRSIAIYSACFSKCGPGRLRRRIGNSPTGAFRAIGCHPDRPSGFGLIDTDPAGNL